MSDKPSKKKPPSKQLLAWLKKQATKFKRLVTCGWKIQADYLQNAKELLEKIGEAATCSSIVIEIRREHRLKSSFIPGFEKIVAGNGVPREPSFRERIAKKLIFDEVGTRKVIVDE